MSLFSFRLETAVFFYANTFDLTVSSIIDCISSQYKNKSDVNLNKFSVELKYSSLVFILNTFLSSYFIHNFEFPFFLSQCQIGNCGFKPCINNCAGS